jgi:rubredoxin
MTTFLPSIQGETVRDPGPVEWADESDVDEYVDNHSEGVQTCRARRLHEFPVPRTGAEFTDIDREGNFIALYQCTSCRLAYRREVWAPGGKRNGRTRWERLDSTVIYRPGEDGENYLLPPGHGRMRPVQVRESLMSRVMEGQSPAAIRKAIQRMQKGD